MQKIKKTILSLLFCITLLLTVTQTQGASLDYITVVVPTTQEALDTQHQSVLHSSGKFVFATTGDNNLTLVVYIVDGDGNFESRVTVAVSGSTRIKSIIMMEHDTDEVIIHTMTQFSGKDHYSQWHRVNINTYGSSSSTTYTQALQQINSKVFGGFITYQGSKYYSVFTAGKDAGFKTRIYCIDYDPSTGTQTESDSSSGSDFSADASWVYGFLSSDNTRAYLVYGTNPMDQPRYFELVFATKTFTLLATHPSGSRYDDTRNLKFLGGGVEESGTDDYLYFTWGYSLVTGTVRQYNIVQHRLVFDWAIVPANLTAQDELFMQITPTIETGATESTFLGGYLEDKDEIHIYYANKPSATLATWHVTLTIADWFSLSTSLAVDSSENVIDTVPLIDGFEIVHRDFEIKFQINEQVSAGTARIYYDLVQLEIVWDLTVSYTPSDDPLDTATWYTHTLQATANDINTQCVIQFLADGSIRWTSETSTTGTLVMTSIQYVGGSHNYTWILFYENDQVHVETRVYVFVDAYDPQDVPSEQVLPYSINSILLTLPLFFIIFIPALLLGQMFGAIGFIGGMSAGAVVGAMSGIIPMYAVYLMLLITVGFIILLGMGRRRGGF